MAYAAKYDYAIDANQELVALGAANVSAGLFQGFTIDASLSQTATAEQAGQELAAMRARPTNRVERRPLWRFPMTIRRACWDSTR